MRFTKESECRNHRCCGPQGCGDVQTSEERKQNPVDGRICIGRHCMAWRTEQDFMDPDAYGYCGLAGSPYRIVIHPGT